MNSFILKQVISLALLGLVCLASAARAQDEGTTVIPVAEPPTPALPSTDELILSEDEEPEIGEEQEEFESEPEEFGDEEFLISLEDSLAQFVIRHRDVRRDCDDIQIDLQIQQESGEPADLTLRQEYLGCMKYKRELEENIIELATRISRPSPEEPIELPSPTPRDPASLDQAKNRGGFLSSITNRLPTLF